MDRIRTLLLARTHLVVLDPDQVANAATRPTRSSDLDRFEADLVQLGFVMSLDLAITIRRLPHQAIAELRTWTLATLADALGGDRPQVPLFRQLPAGLPADTWTPYTQRVLSWLHTRAEQPCPWCGELRAVGAINPCGHLVCRTCWQGGSFVGCPICHRRVSATGPFLDAAGAPGLPPPAPVTDHPGTLRLLHLGFDLIGSARQRFERLVTRATPLTADERGEVETVIDELGPTAASWLPARIPIAQTMAIALARLWTVAPDRPAMVRATQHHLRSATDVLRVAVVLMGGEPGLTGSGRLASIPRGLRGAVLEALDRLPAEALVEEVRRHVGRWKRVGERLHPYEHAQRLPTAALAFAVVRGTRLSSATFGAALGAQATQVASVRLEDDQVHVIPWRGAVEDALRAGDARAAVARLAAHPGELLRRADHLVRVAQARQPDALAPVLAAIQRATAQGSPVALLTLASHIARRGAPRSRRVVFPGGELRRAWELPDHRAPLAPAAIARVVDAVRAELVARAVERRGYPRAVIDRGLADLRLPVGRHHAALVHVDRDRAELAGIGTRPTLWELACIHAAARANVVYVRERDGTFTTFRRRDGEVTAARLARLLAGDSTDGTLAAIPPANAPTWCALLRGDLALPAGSAGYVAEPPPAGATGVTWLTVGELLAELAARP